MILFFLMLILLYTYIHTFVTMATAKKRGNIVPVPVHYSEEFKSKTTSKFEEWARNEISIYIGDDQALPSSDVGDIDAVVRSVVDEEMLSFTYACRLLRVQVTVTNAIKVLQRKICGYLLGYECSKVLELPFFSFSKKESDANNNRDVISVSYDSINKTKSVDELSKLCIDNFLYLYRTVGIELNVEKYHEFRIKFLKDVPRRKWEFLLKAQQLADYLSKQASLHEVRESIMHE